MALSRWLLALLTWTAVTAEQCSHGHPAGCTDVSGLSRAHGDVWRERAGLEHDGSCVRRVSACVDGRLLKPVRDRAERCPPKHGNNACRMESFFSCCPVYDCRAKLASLISPGAAAQLPSSPYVRLFLGSVDVSDLYDSAGTAVPVARPALNASDIRRLLSSLRQGGPPTQAERAAERELRTILAVLEATERESPPPEALLVLQLLREVLGARRGAVVSLLRRVLGQAGGQDSAQALLSAALALVTSGSPGARRDVALLRELLRRVDELDMPLDRVLYYVVTFGDSDVDPKTVHPATSPQTTCAADQEGLVWADMTEPENGQCTRQVRACVNGVVVTSDRLESLTETCEPADPELLEVCRVRSFFTCCPIYDCAERLRATTSDTESPDADEILAVIEMLGGADDMTLSSATSPVPVVGPVLNKEVVEAMWNVMENNSVTEGPLVSELSLLMLLLSDSELPSPTTEAPLPGPDGDELQRLVETLELIALDVQLPSLAADTARDLARVSRRLAGLRDFLLTGVPRSMVPAELPQAIARLTFQLSLPSAAGPGVPVSPGLVDLFMAASSDDGSLPALDLATLIGEFGRVAEEWIQSRTVGATRPRPPPDPTDPAGDPLRRAMRLLWKLVEEMPGRVSLVVYRDFRELADLIGRRDDVVPPEAMELLLTIVRTVGDYQERLNSEFVTQVLELIGLLPQGDESLPTVQQVLIELLQRLEPAESAVAPEVLTMLVELLERLGAPHPGVTPIVISLVGDVSQPRGGDVSPQILRKLLALLERMAESPDSRHAAVMPVIVRLMGRVGHPRNQATPVLDVLVSLLEEMVETRPAEPEIVQVIVQLADHLSGRPDRRPAHGLLALVTQLMRHLQRHQTDLTSAVEDGVIRVVTVLSGERGHADPGVQQLLMTLMELLAGRPDSRRQGEEEADAAEVLLLLLQLAEQPETPDRTATVVELLKQLERLMKRDRVDVPAEVSRRIWEMVIGAQAGRQSGDEELVTLVLTLLGMVPDVVRRPEPPTITFNITGPAGGGRDEPDLEALLRLVLAEIEAAGAGLTGRDAGQILTILIGMNETQTEEPDPAQGLILEELLKLIIEQNTGSRSPIPDITLLFNITETQSPDNSELLQLLIDFFLSLDAGSPTPLPDITLLFNTTETKSPDNTELFKLLIDFIVSLNTGTPSPIPDITLLVNTTENKPPNNSELLQLLMEFILSLNTGSPPPIPDITLLFNTTETGSLDNTELLQLLLEFMLSLNTDSPSPIPDITLLFNSTETTSPNYGELLQLLMDFVLSIDTGSSQPTPNITLLFNTTEPRPPNNNELLQLLMELILSFNTDSPSPIPDITLLFNTTEPQPPNNSDLFQLLMDLLLSLSTDISTPFPDITNITLLFNSTQTDTFDNSDLIQILIDLFSEALKPSTQYPDIFNISFVGEPASNGLDGDILAALRRLVSDWQQPEPNGGGVTITLVSDGTQPRSAAPDLLSMVLLLQELAAQSQRPAEYLPLLVTLLQSVAGEEGALGGEVAAELAALLVSLLPQDLAGQELALLEQIVEQLRPREGADWRAVFTAALPLLEALVEARGLTAPADGGDVLSGLLALLGGTPESKHQAHHVPGGVGAWLSLLLGAGSGEQPGALSEQGRFLLSQLIRLIREKTTRSGDAFLTAGDAHGLLELLTGRESDPAVVADPAAFRLVLELLDVAAGPVETPDQMLGRLRARVAPPSDLLLDALGLASPAAPEPADVYLSLLQLLTDVPLEADLPADALHHALVLLLAGADAATPGMVADGSLDVLLSLLPDTPDDQLLLTLVGAQNPDEHGTVDVAAWLAMLGLAGREGRGGGPVCDGLMALLNGGAQGRPGAPPRSCRLICGSPGDAGETSLIQTVAGQTPVNFVGENHVLIVNP